jgi:hypothetical protein
MKRCPFPDCGASLVGLPKCTVWCKLHAAAIRTSRVSRRQARASRAGRKSYGHCVTKGRALNNEPKREPQVKCKHCCGQPWARLPERLNERSGSGACGAEVPVAYQPGLGVPGWHVPVCRGCGLAHEPEPKPDRGCLIRSSAGAAADHGARYG